MSLPLPDSLKPLVRDAPPVALPTWPGGPGGFASPTRATRTTSSSQLGATALRATPDGAVQVVHDPLDVLLWLVAVIVWNEGALHDMRDAIAAADATRVAAEKEAAKKPRRSGGRGGSAAEELPPGAFPDGVDAATNVLHVNPAHRSFQLLRIRPDGVARVSKALAAFGVRGIPPQKLVAWFRAGQDTRPLPREQVLVDALLPHLEDESAVEYVAFVAGHFDALPECAALSGPTVTPPQPGDDDGDDPLTIASPQKGGRHQRGAEPVPALKGLGPPPSQQQKRRKSSAAGGGGLALFDPLVSAASSSSHALGASLSVASAMLGASAVRAVQARRAARTECSAIVDYLVTAAVDDAIVSASTHAALALNERGVYLHGDGALPRLPCADALQVARRAPPQRARTMPRNAPARVIARPSPYANVTAISIRFCGLTTIDALIAPDGSHNAPALKRLNISNNRLHTLPVELLLAHAVLTSIIACGNCIEGFSEIRRRSGCRAGDANTSFDAAMRSSARIPSVRSRRNSDLIPMAAAGAAPALLLPSPEVVMNYEAAEQQRQQDEVRERQRENEQEAAARAAALAELAKKSRLTELDLAHNRFHGTFPPPVLWSRTCDETAGSTWAVAPPDLTTFHPAGTEWWRGLPRGVLTSLDVSCNTDVVTIDIPFVQHALERVAFLSFASLAVDNLPALKKAVKASTTCKAELRGPAPPPERPPRDGAGLFGSLPAHALRQATATLLWPHQRRDATTGSARRRLRVAMFVVLSCVYFLSRAKRLVAASVLMLRASRRKGKPKGGKRSTENPANQAAVAQHVADAASLFRRKLAMKHLPVEHDGDGADDGGEDTADGGAARASAAFTATDQRAAAAHRRLIENLMEATAPGATQCGNFAAHGRRGARATSPRVV